MEFSITMAGTASAMPVKGKNQSAQVLSVRGRLFLIDCGEGVQSRLVEAGIPMMKIDSIFISHIHGDHVFGLFGLLSTLGMKGRRIPLGIYAPANFGPIMKFFLSYYGDGLGYELNFTPLVMKSPERVFESKSIEVLAFPLNHRIETYGFLFREKEPQLNVRKEAVAALGLSLTEIGAIKRGEDVVRGDGSVIYNADVAYRPYSPRSYAYCSDTAPFPQLPEWVHGVDLLYHECTYLAAYEEQARLRYHSTTLQAAACAAKAGAGKLVIGHYSSRCRDPRAYEAECRTVFPETWAASDGDVFEIPFIKAK